MKNLLFRRKSNTLNTELVEKDSESGKRKA